MLKIIHLHPAEAQIIGNSQKEGVALQRPSCGCRSRNGPQSVIDSQRITPLDWVVYQTSKPAGCFAPVENFEKDRSFIATAVNWASQVTSVALEMVVPPVLGFWIYQKLGTGFLFVSLGAIFWFCTWMFSLLKMASSASRSKRP